MIPQRGPEVLDAAQEDRYFQTSDGRTVRIAQHGCLFDILEVHARGQYPIMDRVKVLWSEQDWIGVAAFLNREVAAS